MHGERFDELDKRLLSGLDKRNKRMTNANKKEIAKEGKVPAPIAELAPKTIDQLLDIYIDYKILFELFGDLTYDTYARSVLKVLKVKTM